MKETTGWTLFGISVVFCFTTILIVLLFNSRIFYKNAMEKGYVQQPYSTGSLSGRAWIKSEDYKPIVICHYPTEDQ